MLAFLCNTLVSLLSRYMCPYNTRQANEQILSDSIWAHGATVSRSGIFPDTCGVARPYQGSYLAVLLQSPGKLIPGQGRHKSRPCGLSRKSINAIEDSCSISVTRLSSDIWEFQVGVKDRYAVASSALTLTSPCLTLLVSNLWGLHSGIVSESIDSVLAL